MVLSDGTKGINVCLILGLHDKDEIPCSWRWQEGALTEPLGIAALIYRVAVRLLGPTPDCGGERADLR